ncbi:MAG: YihY/virulence factor BrkB family protein [Gammaproteobacteria bacterium]|nr:YihY/virulence factor BrkB family protein [Gammaproteobacteria bacterium]
MRAVFTITTRAIKVWFDGGAFANAAALAFYTIFSLAPIMIFAITATGIVLGPEAAEGRIVGQLEGLIGPEPARVVEQVVADTQLTQTGWLPTLAGVFAMALGATAVFVQLQRALNSIWNVTSPRHSNNILSLLINRLLSLVIALIFGLVIMASLLTSVILRAINRFASEWLTIDTTLMTFVETSASLALMTLLFALMFRILPDISLSWKDALPGAAITALLFMLGRYLIASYLTFTAPASAYGAAGSLVLLLVWIYASALILLFGAAITRAMTHGENP